MKKQLSPFYPTLLVLGGLGGELRSHDLIRLPDEPAILCQQLRTSHTHTNTPTHNFLRSSTLCRLSESHSIPRSRLSNCLSNRYPLSSNRYLRSTLARTPSNFTYTIYDTPTGRSPTNTKPAHTHFRRRNTRLPAANFHFLLFHKMGHIREHRIFHYHVRVC